MSVTNRVEEWRRKWRRTGHALSIRAHVEQLAYGIDWAARRLSVDPYVVPGSSMAFWTFPRRGWLQRGPDGLLLRRYPLQDFQRALIDGVPTQRITR